MDRNLLVMAEALTPSQAKVLDCICSHIDQHFFPPTIEELQKTLNHASTFSVRKHIGTLVKKGYLLKAKGLSRALVVIKDSTGNSLNAKALQRLST